jgi:hypothetical protein
MMMELGYVLNEIYYRHGTSIFQGPCLHRLSEFIDRDKHMGQAPHDKWLCNGDGLELLGQSMDLPCEVLASPVGPHDLSNITGSHLPVKTLPESLSDRDT